MPGFFVELHQIFSIFIKSQNVLATMNLTRGITIFLFILLIHISAYSKDKYLIGFSQCSQGEWRENMEAEMARELMFHPNLEILVSQAGDDNQLQIEQIKAFVEKGVDLLIIAPNEIKAIQPVIEEAFHSGIPVVLIDRKIDSEQYTAYVGGDNYGIGRAAGQYISSKLNSRGEIIEIQGALSASPARERTKGFNEFISSISSLLIVNRLETRWETQTIEDSLSLLLERYKNLKAVFAHTDFMAESASQIIGELFPNRDILIVGVDGLPNEGGGISLVENGIISASLIYPTGGKEAIQIAAKILQEIPFNKHNLLPTTLIDQSNVEMTRLQFQTINALQQDISKSQGMLKMLDGRYKKQQVLLFVTLLLLVLVAVLLILYFRAFNHKKIANQNLEKQKGEISSQNKELKRLSMELESVTQEKLRFYTNISHEFRTPLTLISGPVSNLSQHENLNYEQKELLSIAQKNITILLKLIEQIIDFRKYEQGKHGFSPVTANLKNYIQEWNCLFNEVSRQKKIAFELELDANSDFEVDFDIEKMERVYTNLLANAFKFTPRDGEIKVSLKREVIEKKERVCVDVVNSGKAIPESDIRNIFDRFYQSGSKSGGSGIGLALVKGYIELHDGTINVINKDGSVCFSFTIPVKQKGSSKKVAENMAPVSESEIDRKDEIRDVINLISEQEDSFTFDDEFNEGETTLLIVDDHPGIRSYFKTLLKEKYNVIEARDGVEGIRKAVKYVPDLIISDVMMPGIDGVEMCKHLKKEVTTSHIPIILLTANAQDEKRILGFESGADEYISKPANFEILEARIRNLIGSRKQLKALFESATGTEVKQAKINQIDKSFIDRFEEQIEKHIQDTELSVDFISKEIGLSRIQLYRKVKALTDYSPVELLTIYRLKKAVHLMSVSDSNLAQIAYQVGFSAPSYFSKSFKKYYQKSPSEYLRDIRNK